MGGIKMFHIKIVWHHDNQYDPVTMYCELDANRYEVRKIEIFRSGKILHVTEKAEIMDSCMLSELPWPTIEEINQDSQFIAREISQEEFQHVWLKYVNK